MSTSYSYRNKPVDVSAERAFEGKTIPVIFDTVTAGYESLDDKLIERLKLPVKKWTAWLESSGAQVGKVLLALGSGTAFRADDVERRCNRRLPAAARRTRAERLPVNGRSRRKILADCHETAASSI